RWRPPWLRRHRGREAAPSVLGRLQNSVLRSLVKSVCEYVPEPVLGREFEHHESPRSIPRPSSFLLRDHFAVMRVEMPPRGVKSPSRVAEIGWAHFTTSASMRFTMFSWKMPRLRNASVYILSDFNSRHNLSGTYRRVKTP